MATTPPCESSTPPSPLAERTATGEEIVIAKVGQPMALPAPPRRVGPRPLGLLRGQAVLGNDVDAPLPERMARAFRGETP